jgi:hypothetical protein
MASSDRTGREGATVEPGLFERLFRVVVGGPRCCYIVPVFRQIRDRLKPSGTLYMVLSNKHSDREAFASSLTDAGLRVHAVHTRSAFVDLFLIHEVRLEGGL